jgi:serine/threonine-protein kinase
MSLAAGVRLGGYEVEALIGAGGMGEVYRARDIKLGRFVAVKVLPEAFAADADRVARFQREAQLLASLNHPHIAALHGMEDTSAGHLLVMELVEGETLADRLQRGALPVEEALKIARQIAEALEAAHEKGIVHRDLKPANVKITPDDQVKVLDFGLAKAMETSPAAAADLTRSPTLSMMATQAGMVLGTAAYMSPEQAKGFPADQRSDIFSFGSVLYEMLTGRQPFQGDTAPDILASVIVREPDLTKLTPNLNPRLAELLRRCLEKSPKKRWQAIGDVRAEIETIAAAPHSTPALAQALAPPQPLWRRAIPFALTAIAVGGLAGTVGYYSRPAPAVPVVTRFSFALGDGQRFTNPGRHLVAISPDGTRMAYVANSQLYLRSMSELEARPILGTENPSGITNPVFSPDGRSLVFYTGVNPGGGALKIIAVTGGVATTVCTADNPSGITWERETILFGQGNKGIMRVSQNGGKPELLVRVSGDELAHGPQMLPDRQTVLFTLATGTGADRWDKGHIVVQSLRSGERKTLIEGGSDARYLPTGHLVYALGGVLFSVPFDLTRLEVTGGPVPIVEGVRRGGPTTGAAHFSFSDIGSLIYVPGPVSTTAAQSDLALIDRKGSTEQLKLPAGPYQFPRVSQDGNRIAFATDDGKEAIIWIFELSRTASMRRLTFGGKNRFPIWSADGQRVAFQSDREGDLGIFWQRADGSGAAERLTKPDQGTSHVPESWSPRGERFLFGVTKGSSVSLWTFSLQDNKATQFADVQSLNPINAAFSTDGRWVAYTFTEAGAPWIYVQPFPATGAKYQVSKTGGVIHPVWSRDGRELVSQPVGQWVVQTITTEPGFSVSAPVPVPRGGAIGTPPAAQRNYDVMPDGRILGVVPAEQTQFAVSATPQIQVVLNWLEELKRRVPAK